MKASLIYWQKARLQGRYVLEMKIHQVGKSARYKDGIKYGLILTDTKTDSRVLMDNHHPKGPHIHLNDEEIPCQYTHEEKLIRDFKSLVLKIWESNYETPYCIF